MFSLLEDGGVATKVNVCMSTCMCICTMLYLIVFHLSELFTYPNEMFVALDQWGSDNRGFTVLQSICICISIFMYSVCIAMVGILIIGSILISSVYVMHLVCIVYKCRHTVV